MSIPLESIEVGRCYLAWARSAKGERSRRVRQVIELLPDGRVKFAMRRRPIELKTVWPRTHVMTIAAFARSAEREVPRDWTPEGVNISPESIEIGKCYLTKRGVVRRVLRLLPGRVQFERRTSTKSGRWAWTPDLTDLRAFALSTEREVPCDWTPEEDG